MEANKIRAIELPNSVGALEKAKVEILQEIAAQLAELNENIKEAGGTLFELTNGTRSLSVYTTDVHGR